MAKEKAIEGKHPAYIRDVNCGYLIDGARKTKEDEFPIIEKWMVASAPPRAIVQWDKRREVVDKAKVTVSHFCADQEFLAVKWNPQKYLDEVRQYEAMIGFDASPYDNMPLVLQKSQIYHNLAISYYFGRHGVKIYPNVRLGDMRTLSSLDAYPKETLIAIGTNGFIKAKSNRQTFSEEVKIVVDKLHPTGIIVYGSTPDWLFEYPKSLGIPIYQYDSYIMKRREYRKKGGHSNERV